MRDEKEYNEYGNEKEKVYITVSHSIKLPYSNWPEEGKVDAYEANQRAWDETRELMNRLTKKD